MSVNLLLVPDHDTQAWTQEGFPATPLHSYRDVQEAFQQPATHRRITVWIVPDASQLMPLAGMQSLTSNHRLLLLRETQGLHRDLLHLLFRVVVAPGNGFHLLPVHELREVLASHERADLFIGGAIDAEAELAVFYRGNLDPLVVPFAWFQRRKPKPKPKFSNFRLIDYGQTVQFGRYEASTDAILYAHDPDYRRRAKARLAMRDDSFGGSLRRLRLMKGVARSDFAGISEKQIARIERGEVKTVRPRTVTLIAGRLGVEPSEISSY